MFAGCKQSESVCSVCTDPDPSRSSLDRTENQCGKGGNWKNLANDSDSDSSDVEAVSEHNYGFVHNSQVEKSESTANLSAELVEAFIMANQCSPTNIGRRENHFSNHPASLNSLFQRQPMAPTPRKDRYINQLFRTPVSQPLPMDMDDDNESVVCLGPPVPSTLYVQRPSTTRIDVRRHQNRTSSSSRPTSTASKSVETRPVIVEDGMPPPALNLTLSSDGKLANNSVIPTEGPGSNVVTGKPVDELNENCFSVKSASRADISPTKRQKCPTYRSSRECSLEGFNSFKKQKLCHLISSDEEISHRKEIQQISSTQSCTVDKPLPIDEGNRLKSHNTANEDDNNTCQVTSVSSPTSNQGTSKNNNDATLLDPYLDELMQSFREHVKGRCMKHFDLSKSDSFRKVKDGIVGAAKRIKPNKTSFRTFLELFSFVDPGNYSHEIERAYALDKKRRKQEQHVKQIEYDLKKLDEKLEEMNVKFVAGISKRGDKKDFNMLKNSYIKKYLEYHEVTGTGTSGPFTIEFNLSDASPYSQINDAVETYLKQEDFKCKHELERDNFCAPDFPTILELVVNTVAEHKLKLHEDTYAIAENIYVRTIKSYKKARETLMWNNVFECVADDLSEEQKRASLRYLDSINSVQSLAESLNWNAKVARHTFQHVLDKFADMPIDEDDEGVDTEDLYHSDDESELCDDERSDDSDYDPEDDFIDDQNTIPPDSINWQLQTH